MSCVDTDNFLIRHADSATIRWRLTALVSLLAIEFLFLSFRYDAYLILDSDRPLAEMLAYAGQLSRFVIGFFVAFLIAAAPRIKNLLAKLICAMTTHRWRIPLLLQLIVYTVLIVLTDALFGSLDLPYTGGYWVGPLWIGFLFSTLLLMLMSIAPWRFWSELIDQEKSILIVAIGIGVLAWGSAQVTQQFWRPLAELTFILTRDVLELFYTDVISLPADFKLGTSTFTVNIAPACSGYEGMGLITVFTGLYLWVFRRDFRFPHALFLFPLGIITIWLFNVLRIAALIAIGSSVSSEIALDGFHSQAGWISFITVACAILLAAHRISFFTRVNSEPSLSTTPVLSTALLVPFIVLLSATLLTSAFSSEFQWLYPMRVVATGIVLIWFWKAYGIKSYRLSWSSPLVGVIVFLLWIILVPPTSENDVIFASNLDQAPGYAAFIWLIFRFIGATVTVPLAEELAFRAYLLCRLIKDAPNTEGPVRFTWLSFLATSILFGALHDAWIAGTLAGMAYALARYHRGSVWDAVLAHAVTNALLSVYVLSSGHWSLW
jgi:exosortase E/protease (VPEID-CTERM system)